MPNAHKSETNSSSTVPKQFGRMSIEVPKGDGDVEALRETVLEKLNQLCLEQPDNIANGTKFLVMTVPANNTLSIDLLGNNGQLIAVFQDVGTLLRELLPNAVIGVRGVVLCDLQ